MALKRFVLSIVGLALLVGVVACGTAPPPPEVYQDQVVRTLEGKAVEPGLSPLPTLVSAVEKLFGALYCAESNCQLPGEMWYLSEIADTQNVVIDSMRGRVCDRDIRPPDEMESVHAEICDSLNRIRLHVDAMMITAKSAAQILAQSMNDPAEQKEISKRYSEKIMERKGKIIEELRELRGISWLAPLFEDADSLFGSR